MGPDHLHIAQVKSEKVKLAQTANPVENPPFNNWSVNQPSVPHISGLNGFADLNQNIIVDGHRVHYAQLDAQINMK